MAAIFFLLTNGADVALGGRFYLRAGSKVHSPLHSQPGHWWQFLHCRPWWGSRWRKCWRPSLCGEELSPLESWEAWDREHLKVESQFWTYGQTTFSQMQPRATTGAAPHVEQLPGVKAWRDEGSWAHQRGVQHGPGRSHHRIPRWSKFREHVHQDNTIL